MPDDLKSPNVRCRDGEKINCVETFSEKLQHGHNASTPQWFDIDNGDGDQKHVHVHLHGDRRDPSQPISSH